MSSYSPSRRQLGGVGAASRLRSSSLKKPPEPLRRAVADCLSSSALPHHGTGSAAGATEASRTLRDSITIARNLTVDDVESVLKIMSILEHFWCISEERCKLMSFCASWQDYLASFVTTDLAYGVILEHTLAERERSPAVVARCIALLKRYLLRYKPGDETLQQIDRFCVSIIWECDMGLNRKVAPWSRSLSQTSGPPVTTGNNTPLPVSTFASGALVKSLNYVRSLVGQHIPRRSFQSAAFAGAPAVSRQALPSLSSLLSKSFNSQLSPANAKDSSDNKDVPATSISDSVISEEADEVEDHDFIALDVFKWRWCGEQLLSQISPKSDHVLNLQHMETHNFLEVGAAALLVGDMEAKMKGEPWKIFGSADMPYLDQLLQPTLLTTVTNSSSARAHLRAITALKRSKQGPHEILDESLVSTYRPRARPLFQYRHYSEQQPLKLNFSEVREVIAAVCSEASSTSSTVMTISSKFGNNAGRPSMDVAVSVLVKLVIDMYVQDSETAGPLTLSMLEEMLDSPILASKCRAFDLILNLGVHAHLLEPPPADDISTIEEEYSQEGYIDNGSQVTLQGKRKLDYLKKLESSAAIDKFECWILGILNEMLLFLVQIEDKEESVWASAISCLLYFVCDRGKIRRSRLKGLDIRVVKVLIDVSRRDSWAEIVHCKLICMMTNMFYEVSDCSNKVLSSTPKFLAEQVDQIGGIEFIFIELVHSKSREERRNLYMVLFDYVLHQINEMCTSAGVSEYTDEEVQPIASLLMLADAPEALHISVKLGVEGILELLRRSVSTALSRYANSDRLTMLSERLVEKFDGLIRAFTHLDKEFTHMIQITKSYQSLDSIDELLASSIGMQASLSWATLHSLLHSERIPYRHHGYLWLGDMLMAEVGLERNSNVWSGVKNLQQNIATAGVKDYEASLNIPLPIWLMCGLLKSKNNLIRWGFLFVLERLLMRCKFLLDESEVQQVISEEAAKHRQDMSRLEKANAVLDIMSSALSLVAQINETDRMNILKLCLKVPPTTAKSGGDAVHSNDFSFVDWSRKADIDSSLDKQNRTDEILDSYKNKQGKSNDPSICETASVAALLLRGQAIVPMQLVARVPAALFYWPLIQLAGAATDNIALGVSVGSKGRGNLPGATSDIRATLLLLLIGKCTADRASFKEVGGEQFFRYETSALVQYVSGFWFLRMMTEEPESYQRMLQNLVAKAQQSNNEKLLENPYLQMRGLLQLSSE
ncbi:hypothetical protein Leryth_008636 [Lithospermum erythrorhizon]|nr:hypothetical protein Leryth_008636 [Lithospermum erythrorhizon]